MDDEILPWIGLGVFLTITWAFAVAWWRASRRARRLEHALIHGRPPDDRVARLEETVDALSARLDRVGEAQEFLTRMLTKRLAGRPRPEVTPH